LAIVRCRYCDRFLDYETKHVILRDNPHRDENGMSVEQLGVAGTCEECWRKKVKPMNIDDKIYVGEVPPEDATTQEVLDATSPAVKDRWLCIFIQLIASKRYKAFISANYDIADSINEEEKSIETLVIEKPLAVGPPLSPLQTMNIGKFLVDLKCQDVPSALQKFMAILGQDAPAISLSTDIESASKLI